jgi:hypothetical protein
MLSIIAEIPHAMTAAILPNIEHNIGLLSPGIR